MIRGGGGSEEQVRHCSVIQKNYGPLTPSTSEQLIQLGLSFLGINSHLIPHWESFLVYEGNCHFHILTSTHNIELCAKYVDTYVHS